MCIFPHILKGGDDDTWWLLWQNARYYSFYNECVLTCAKMGAFGGLLGHIKNKEPFRLDSAISVIPFCGMGR